jgi:hypothetical protein
MKPVPVLCLLWAAALTLWILAAWWLVPVRDVGIDAGITESMIALKTSVETMNESLQAANAAMDSAFGCNP